MEELLDQNAGILHVLPNILSGLIKHEPVYDILLDSVENALIRSQLLEMEIDRNVTELSFDQDKAALLSMLLGNSFINALDLVFNLEISGPLWNISIVPVLKRDIAHLLAKLRLCWKNEQLVKGSLQFIHREEGSHTHVDLSNWYCECQEYQSKYIDEMQVINIRGDSFLEQLFQNMKSKPLSPLPICTHIIVILIVKYNSTYFNI